MPKRSLRSDSTSDSASQSSVRSFSSDFSAGSLARNVADTFEMSNIRKIQAAIEINTRKINNMQDTLNKLVRDQKSMLRYIEELVGSESTGLRSSKDSKEVFERRIENKLKSKRKQDWWITKVKTLKIDGVNENDLQTIKDLLLHGPASASILPIKIARILWTPAILEKNMIPPKTREARKGERSEFLSENEAGRLKDILSLVSKSYKEKTEWRILVRDPINQATRGKSCKFVERNRNEIERVEEEDSQDSVGRNAYLIGPSVQPGHILHDFTKNMQEPQIRNEIQVENANFLKESTSGSHTRKTTEIVDLGRSVPLKEMPAENSPSTSKMSVSCKKSKAQSKSCEKVIEKRNLRRKK